MGRGNTVTISILGDASNATRAFAGVADQASRLGDGLKKFGKVAATAVAAAGVAAGAFAAQAIKAGSDMAETLSKSNTIFGDNARAIEKWASGAAKDFGQSKQQALEAAATFGNMFTQLGVGTKTAAGMSKQMVELASDFASFHNTSSEEALNAMTAAFRGEYDAVQRFVPTINAAAVEQKALAMGLAGTTKELDAQDKALATQALLMEGSGKALGDRDRTAGSLANRLKEFEASSQDLKATVGTALIPVLLNVWDAFDRIGTTLKSQLAPIFDTVKLGVQAFAAAFKEGDVTSDGFVGVMERLGNFARDVVVPAFLHLRDVFQSVVAFVKDNTVPVFAGLGVAVGGALLAGIIALVTAIGALLSPFVLIVAAVAAVVAGLVYAYKNFEGFRNVVQTVVDFITDTVVPGFMAVARVVMEQLGNAVDWVKSIWPQVQEAIGHVLVVVEEIIGAFVDAVMSVWRAWGDDIFNIVKTIFRTIGEVIDGVLGFIRGLIQTVLAVINGDWGKAWDGIKQMVGGVWDVIVGIVRGALELIQSVLGMTVSILQEVWRGLWDVIARVANAAWDGLWRSITGAFGSLVDFFRGLPGAIANVATGLFDGIKDAFRAALNWIIDKWNGLSLRLPEVDLGPLGKVGGFKLDTPDIPRFAKGGIVTGPTLAVVGDNPGGREAIIPLPAGGRGMPSGNTRVIIEFNHPLTDRAQADYVVRLLQTHFSRGGSIGNGRGGTLAPA